MFASVVLIEAFIVVTISQWYMRLHGIKCCNTNYKQSNLIFLSEIINDTTVFDMSSSSFLFSSSEISDENSFPDLLSKRYDLKSKLEAVIQTKKQFQEKENELNQTISKLQVQGDASIKHLEDIKQELTDEKDRLILELSELPTIDFLEKQIETLEQQSSYFNPSQSKETLNIQSLVDIGIKKGESITKLSEKLNLLVSKLRELKSEQNNLSLSHDNFSHTDEENELRRKILLFERTSNTAYEMKKRQFHQYQIELDNLKSSLHIQKQNTLRERGK